MRIQTVRGLLSVRPPIRKDVKGSNADNSHRSHQRISCQFSDSAPSQQFATVSRRLRIQRCIYCNVTYCDPRHMQWHFTYYKCLRVKKKTSYYPGKIGSTIRMFQKFLLIQNLPILIIVQGVDMKQTDGCEHKLCMPTRVQTIKTLT